MEAFAALADWPAERVAVAVLSGDGAVRVERHGAAVAPFRLASVTKLLTAYAVLVAVEEGGVELDEPAGPPGATVAHLLAHASGLAPGERRSVAAPGARRIYSNAGFELLAEHVARRTGIGFADYLAAAVVEPLGMTATRLDGSPAAGAVGPLDDLVAFAGELRRPRLLHPDTVARATAVAFPGLSGVLPGFGRQEPNDWGLGFELRGTKHPHWTGRHSSPRTFGHFGRSGTFLWVDPDADAACVCLTDTAFGPWAAQAWPAFTDAVLAELAAQG